MSLIVRLFQNMAESTVPTVIVIVQSPIMWFISVTVLLLARSWVGTLIILVQSQVIKFILVATLL